MAADLTGNVDLVLERDRNPQQRRLLARRDPAIGLGGGGSRLIGVDRDEGVDLWVDLLDSLQVEIDQLA